MDYCRFRTLQQPVTIDGVDVELVRTYKYLGLQLDDKLEWLENTDNLYRKRQSWLYFLRTLGSFNISRKLLHFFYQSMGASVLFYAMLRWGGSILRSDAMQLDKLVGRAASVVDMELDSLVTVAERRTMRKLPSIMDNESHPLRTTMMRQEYVQCQVAVTELPNGQTPLERALSQEPLRANYSSTASTISYVQDPCTLKFLPSYVYVFFHTHRGIWGQRASLALC